MTIKTTPPPGVREKTQGARCGKDGGGDNARGGCRSRRLLAAVRRDGVWHAVGFTLVPTGARGFFLCFTRDEFFGGVQGCRWRWSGIFIWFDFVSILG